MLEVFAVRYRAGGKDFKEKRERLCAFANEKREKLCAFANTSVMYSTWLLMLLQAD
jgi:hypothetical protein